MNYTKGPWRTGDVYKTVFGPPNGNPSPETIASVRKRENAALIAAAPDMFEALEQAVKWLGKAHAEGIHHNAVMPNHLAYTMNLVEKAITKAKGVS